MLKDSLLFKNKVFKAICITYGITLLSSILPSFASEISHPPLNETLSNQNMITNQKIEASPYSAIPGNLSDMHSDVTKDHWTYQALYELSKKYKVIEGMPDNTFEGNRPVKRYEMVQALAKLLQYIEAQHIELSSLEKAAITSLKTEYKKDILTLSGRVEENTKAIAAIEETHTSDMNEIKKDLREIKNSYYFTPEMRFRGRLGDPDASCDTRVRLSSKSYITPRTYYRIRLEASTGNLVNNSELNGDVVDTDLTLAYVNTGDLTRWIPSKLGRVNLFGGILTPRRIFTRDYRVDVDQRGFSDSNIALSVFNSQIHSFITDGDDGRRMTAGGEYIKRFRKYRGLIKAGAARSTGGSLNATGVDVSSSGDESTFYVVTGQMEIPTKKNPIELKVSHSYLFGTQQGNKNTWSAGGRIATKIDNVGVIKGAIIGHGGSAPVRYLDGRGGHGISYQLAFNPASDVFGDLFGDPQKITANVYDYIPGKTEFGIAFANLHNRDDESLRALDIFASRYFSRNLWGLVRFTHLNPNTNSFRNLSNRNYVEFVTIFRF